MFIQGIVASAYTKVVERKATETRPASNVEKTDVQIIDETAGVVMATVWGATMPDGSGVAELAQGARVSFPVRPSVWRDREGVAHLQFTAHTPRADAPVLRAVAG